MVLRSSVLRQALVVCVALGAIACGRRPPTQVVSPTRGVDVAQPPHAVIPVPASIQLAPNDTFTVDSTTAVVVSSGAGPDAERVGAYLAYLLGGPLGPPSRTLAPGETAPPRSVHLSIDASRVSLGLEGYEL